MSKKPYFFVILLFLLSCKGYHAPEPVRIVGSQKEFQHFHPTSNLSQYFVLANRKINFLNVNSPLTLNLTSVLPLEIDFEKVAGNTDTLYVQTASELKLMHLDASAWSELGVIGDLKPCDNFLTMNKFIVIAKGNDVCRTSNEVPTITVYNSDSLEVPVDRIITSSTLGTKSLTLQRYGKTIFLANPVDGLTIYEISATGKLIIISSYPQIKTDRIDIFETKKIAIIKTLRGITQYSLADLKNLKELGSVK
jgi:hypothetical protein